MKIQLRGKVIGLNNFMRIPPIKKIKPRARILSYLFTKKLKFIEMNDILKFSFRNMKPSRAVFPVFY